MCKCDSCVAESVEGEALGVNDGLDLPVEGGSLFRLWSGGGIVNVDEEEEDDKRVMLTVLGPAHGEQSSVSRVISDIYCELHAIERVVKVVVG